MIQLEAKVRLYESDKDDSIKGFASLNIGGEFVINDLTIRKSKEGNLYVSFPSKKGKEKVDGKDKYWDIAHPITKESQALAKETVLKAYQQAILEA